MAFYKRDPQQYKHSIMNAMNEQMEIIDVYIKELLKLKYTDEVQFQASLETYMADSEV